ncbi:melanopsin-like [Stylophora pistillata]|uniref:melanopsin-like n=1 Tax=Stylophora pistillata TaxID=50429 RepID=UPI000C049779|nr:melanopsin-like [Stylophora pistillata]
MVATIYIAFTVASTIIFIPGVVLNFLICLVFYKSEQFRTPPNVFITSVAASDLFFSATTLPPLIATNAYGRWSYGEKGCKAAAFITAFSGLVSMMHLAAASYERYNALVFPLTSSTTITFQKAVRISVALWLYSLFWSVMPLCGWSGYAQEGIGTSCAVKWRSRDKLDLSYNICLIFACFLLPVSVMSFSYFKCCKEIVSGTRRAKTIWGKTSNFTRIATEMEHKMLILFGIMTVAFLMAWTPYAIVSIISMIGGPYVISDVAASIPAYLAKSSYCLNPIVYVFRNKRLRRQIKCTIRCAK